MVIKGTKTIAQYKIMQWVQENFIDNVVEVEFTGNDIATIKDTVGAVLKVKFENDEIKEIE